MLNWTCNECNSLNTPRKDICWNCGYDRTNTTYPTHQPQNDYRGNIWLRLFPAFRIMGAVGAAAIIASLFLPWIIRQAPQGGIELYAGHTTIYGLITAVIGLILLFFMVKPDLRKGWYILAIILAIIAYFVSWMPVQISQVFDAVAAELGGLGAETAVSIAGIGVSVVNIAAVLVIVAAIAQLFRPTVAKTQPNKLALQQG
ncbi:hypothetical protein [Candidatus Leptofilum sp.]|uniref:hypothetical protein n=1 Tax=Candidatus Leptofilum sp. TaxID=3241576 RepID=UPI003B5C6A80